MDTTPDYLTAAEVAKRLHCSLATIYRWTLSGKLRALKRGRVYLFLWSDVEAALEPTQPIRLTTRRELDRQQAEAWRVLEERFGIKQRAAGRA
jgi:excisionase family DNA binding protein